MDILTERQHRALAFISAANAGGYAPLEENVEKWLSDPSPHIMNTSHAIQDAMNALRSFGWSQNKNDTSQLVDLKWATKEPSGRFSLTQLGEALLRNANAQEVEGAHVVMLDNEDPLAYANPMGELAGIGEALLVDPYLDVDGAFDIVEHTDITRALIRAEKNTKGRRSAIASFLRGTKDSRLEVRIADGLHDRFIVAEDDRVWTIGSSINGVANRTSFTVLTPIPVDAAKDISAQIKNRWDDAEPLLSGNDSGESGDLPQ